MNLNATKKGLVVSAIIIAFLIVAYFLFKDNSNSPIMYAAPFIYGLGVVWAISSYAKTQPGPHSFNKLFSQGFKCFIVVTLVLTLYYIIFYKLHPELIEQSAEATRKHLLETEKNRTPAEIEEQVKNGKEHFITMIASITMFQNLFIGAIVSAATAGIIYLSKKK